MRVVAELGVDRFESAIHAIQALIDSVQAFVETVKAFIDGVSQIVYPFVQIVDPLVLCDRRHDQRDHNRQGNVKTDWRRSPANSQLLS